MRRTPQTLADSGNNDTRTFQPEIRITGELPVAAHIFAQGQLVLMEGMNRFAILSPEEEVAHTEELERLTLAHLETSQASIPEDNSDSSNVSTEHPTMTEMSTIKNELSTNAITLPKSPQSNSAQVPKPFSKFTLFLKLPTELRLKIWKHAMPMWRPILIHNTWNQEAFENWDRDHLEDTLECTVSTLTNDSSVFRACKESWAVVQEMTEPVYDESDNPENNNIGPRILASGQLKVRCKFEGNVVIIGRRGITFLDRIASHFKLQGIRALVVSTRMLYGTWQAPRIFDSIKRNCPNLEHLTFTIGVGGQPTAREDPDFVNYVNMDSELTDLVHFLSQMNADGNAYVEYLALLARADRFRAHFRAWVEDVAPEWQNRGFNIGMIVKKRKRGSKGLRIRWDLRDTLRPWTTLVISSQVGNGLTLDSRYAGLKRLFGKQEPLLATVSDQ